MEHNFGLYNTVVSEIDWFHRQITWLFDFALPNI
jgi:hypothetical protein